MPNIVLPDGREVDVTEPTIYETKVLQVLGAIARMLDLLVRLECGATKRADLKRDILETQAAIEAAQAEAAEAAAAAFHPLEEVNPDAEDQA